MIPPEFTNFFIASAGAGAALVGLLFVAVSLAPEQIVTRRAPVERQAVAGSAFTALINAFFLSIVALVPHFYYGSLVVPFSVLCLATSLMQAWHLLRRRKSWPSLLRRTFLVLLGVGLYSLELVNGVQLLNNPSQPAIVFELVWCVIGAFGIGLTRAWELLGAERYGIMGWLSPLRDLDDAESFSDGGNSRAAVEQHGTEEAAPRSSSQ
jgi:hypothetical protein